MNENEENVKPNETLESAPNNEAQTPTSVFADVPVTERRLTLPVGRQLVLVGALLVGVFGLGAFSYLANNLGGPDSSDTDQVSNIATEIIPASPEDPFKNLKVAAASALVIDVRRGEVLYEKQADSQRPLASITKLMTALVAREVVEAGLVVPISNEAVGQAGDSGLTAGERFSIEKLTDLTLLTSSNDGAYALAAVAGKSFDSEDPAIAFVQAMNIRAGELGLTDTSFRNPTGLDLTESEAGAYGTARDVATLLEYILANYPEILEETTKSDTYIADLSGGSHSASNTNSVAAAIPGLIGSKTGYTTLSGGNLAVAFNAGADRPVIVVVLGSTHSGRFSDVLRLVEATKDQLKNEE